MHTPRGKQFKINGNIINVPADVTNTVSMLPRLPKNLKRRLQYKSSVLSLNVRPHKVVQAADWLVSNSSLYKEGRTFNQNWFDNENVLLPPSENDTEQHKEQSENMDCDQVPYKDEDNWSEDEIEIPVGVTDTMLTATDFMTDNELEQTLNVAPGEGSALLSVFRNAYSEELAYPGIFLRQKQPDNTTRLTDVHYSEI